MTPNGQIATPLDKAANREPFLRAVFPREPTFDRFRKVLSSVVIDTSADDLKTTLLSSPSKTIMIFSSNEEYLWVTRLVSPTIFSPERFHVPVVHLIDHFSVVTMRQEHAFME